MVKDWACVNVLWSLVAGSLVFALLGSLAKADPPENSGPGEAAFNSVFQRPLVERPMGPGISNWLEQRISNAARSFETFAPGKMPPPAEGTAYNEAINVALVGDSITKGMANDASIPGGFSWVCWEESCFAARFSAYIQNAYEDGLIPKVNVINIGVSGATSRDYDPNDYGADDYHFLANKLIQTDQGRPLFQTIPASRVVVLYLGTNDTIGIFETQGVVTPGEYKSHLIDIVTTLYRNGVGYVTLVTPPIPSVWIDQPEGERMREYREAILDVCALVGQKADDCYLDLQTDYPADEWIFGAVHPTLAGHEFIGEALFEHLKPLLRRQARSPF